MKIDLINKNNPVIVSIGLLALLTLMACQSPKTPEKTAIDFWSAIAQSDLDKAKAYCTTHSQSALLPSQHDFLRNVTVNYGKIIIDGNQSTVQIQIIHPQNKKSTVTTFLLKEDSHWKVDCQQSLLNFSKNPFNVLLNSLNTLGDTVNQQLQQQIPLIEKEIKSFSESLKQQVDNLTKHLKRSSPQKQTNPYKKSI